MAKKKKRHRRPVAPPVHSAPEAAAHPVGTQSSAPPPARPMGAEPPAPTPPVRKSQPRKRSSTARAFGKKRSRARPWIIGIVLAAAVIAAIVASKMSAQKSSVAFDKVAATAGCGKVQVISGLKRDHLDGQRIKYSTSPPAGGAHYSVPLSAGVYDKPLTTGTAKPQTANSIYRAVHSLEHGAVIIWYDGLSSKDKQDLTSHFDGAAKVIVAPYPQLTGKNHIALSAWGRLDYCSRMSIRVLDAFVARYKDARSAPEQGFPI